MVGDLRRPGGGGRKAIPAAVRRVRRYLHQHGTRIIADGEYVVVESRGKVTTKAGKPYHNQYCQVFRLIDDKIVEVVEYCDTALIDAVL